MPRSVAAVISGTVGTGGATLSTTKGNNALIFCSLPAESMAITPAVCQPLAKGVLTRNVSLRT